MQIYTTENRNGILHVECSGSWTNKSVGQFLQLCNLNKNIEVDITKIEHIDTSGACSLLKVEPYIIGSNEKVTSLMSLCKEYQVPKSRAKELSTTFAQRFNAAVESSIKSFLEFVAFFGELLYMSFKVIKNPRKIRLKATLFHLQHNGFDALTIIFITTFLIGVVIAYQGSVQLERFGANIFIVEMVGIIVTRELSPLIVAIVIAGRSSSSFTAQIGVMRITEEVDAMRTMGFSPWDFLVIPRVVALVIAVPLLVIIGDMVAILGGMVVAKAQLGVGFGDFIERFREVVDIRHVLIGLAKAPVFGFIIAAIGSFRGFQVSSSTESVGTYTTISVVNAIFWVIALDALISVVLTELDL